MYRCKLCVAPVLQSQGRKQLASLTSASCVAALVDLACESGTAKTEATQTYASGYLCNKCFNSIAKYSGLKEELLSKLSKVVVTYDGCEKRYVLSPKRERIGKSLGRNFKRAFAQHSLESQEMGKHLLARIHKMIRVEMKNVLKESTVTVTDSDREVFTTRTWESHYTELQRIAPVLLGILDACIPKHSSRRQCTIAGVIAILVKSHGRSTLAHFFTSLVLYSGHAAKQKCLVFDESDDIPSEPNEYPPQSTPVPAGIGNEGNEEWYGFRLVGDNVDKNVKPRDMRLNSQTTSLHYFHTYAVKDRICFSHLSTDPIEIVQDSINFEMFYPIVGDNTQLVSNLETLVARMFVQRIPGLQSLSAEATPHIKHLYSKQMALKSEVVPLGVMLKNENVLGDMIDILDGLHRYIPTTTTSQTLDVCAESGHTRAVEVKLQNFSYIPLGGDQLTIARIRGSQSILSNSDNGEERLEGFVPVIEDWHMEHLNKLLKGTICHLGANKTPQAIIRVGKALGALKYILEEFDRSTGVWVTTNHTTRSEAEDLMKMVTELSQNKVFSHKPGRKHQIFPSIQCNKLLESINQTKLDLWMTQKVGEILKLSPFSH
eukprot:Em0001g2182a